MSFLFSIDRARHSLPSLCQKLAFFPALTQVDCSRNRGLALRARAESGVHPASRDSTTHHRCGMHLAFLKGGVRTGRPIFPPTLQSNQTRDLLLDPFPCQRSSWEPGRWDHRPSPQILATPARPGSAGADLFQRQR